MADKTGLPPKDRTSGVIEVTEDAFQEMMRSGEDFETGISEKKEPEEPVARHEEPTVVTDEPTTEPPSKEPVDRQALDPNVQQALARIDSLERELEGYRKPARSRTPEPSELEEVIPGVRLPKDRSLWPVKLTPDMVEKAGLSPDATDGLNILANALVTTVVGDLMPPFVQKAITEHISERDTSAQEVEDFFSSYGDLKGMEDLLDVVERQIGAEIREGRIARARSREEYRDRLAERTRRRISSLRGISYEDYMGQVKEPASKPGTVTPMARGRSRAVSTGGGRSTSRPASGQHKDFDDTIDSHLSGE